MTKAPVFIGIGNERHNNIARFDAAVFLEQTGEHPVEILLCCLESRPADHSHHDHVVRTGDTKACVFDDQVRCTMFVDD